MNTFNSQLDYIIPPEIKNDEFYLAIYQLAREADIRTVLEIGSSSGQGSTEAFVRGLRENKNNPNLFCIEVSKARFAELSNTYSAEDFVKCYNVSSVSLHDFSSEAEVTHFYQTISTNLNYYSLQLVLSWLRADLEYIRESGVTEEGIKIIKEENNIDNFDLVLIDGSEFTGVSEFNQVYGAKYILLDDINVFKNYYNCQKLLADSSYRLVKMNISIRNGYAIFQRIEDQGEIFSFSEELSEQLLLKRCVHSGMVAFDVGANLGNYSILLSQLVGIDGKVYTFEPTSTIFSALESRIEAENCQNVSIFRQAVFSENTQIEFHRFPDEYSVWNSIGIPDMDVPNHPGNKVPIIGTEIVDTIMLDSFCQAHQIEQIDYLKIDVEGAEIHVLNGAQELLQKQSIRLIQFEISQKMLEGMNQEARPIFDLLSSYGYECHRIQADGQIGERVFDSNAFYENYVAFPSLPVHFFTIVLNGHPFIQYHIEVFKQLSFPWHWHIVEGVASLNHDTAWSLTLGGQIHNDVHNRGYSNDGTTEYLDELARLYPENITIYRKSENEFWDGKREMVNAPLVNIQQECLLWQIDADELWTSEQIYTARNLFIQNPDKTAAFYWCWYFVGEQLVVTSRNCYSQNPNQEWLRTWKYKPGANWLAHEPPILAEKTAEGDWQNIAAINPFLHEITEAYGLIFQHFAYVTEKQLRFKEQYYGYQDAVLRWQSLQTHNTFPVSLSDFFPWAYGKTIVDKTKSFGLSPIAQRNPASNTWHFISADDLNPKSIHHNVATPLVVVDGIFFQFYKTGIARVWSSLFQEWANDSFSESVLVLDRNKTAPRYPGIRYLDVPPYRYENTDSDRKMLQDICDQFGADIFISTYYTTPVETPSVMMVYDMIPEVIGYDLNQPAWKDKHHAIHCASAFISISQSTVQDLVSFSPEASSASITVANCGVDATFSPANDQELLQFRTKYGITRPYYLLVGVGSGTPNTYKNAELFFEAFETLPIRQAFDVICTGGGTFSPALRAHTSGSTVHMLFLDDDELRLAYSGAIALVYPSKYEGFGMPIAEAMACGCPVITCANSSLPEVAGDAAIYVDSDDPNAMTEALCEVLKPDLRAMMIAEGLAQVKRFSWATMAHTVKTVLIETTLNSLNLREQNWLICPDWSCPEDILMQELADVIRAIAQQPDPDQTALLIYLHDYSEDDANLLISGIAMNLYLEGEVSVEAAPEITLFKSLKPLQWQALSQRLAGRLQLEHNSSDAIAALQAVPIRPITDLINHSTV
jgi:FkbM family methyltransferase